MYAQHWEQLVSPKHQINDIESNGNNVTRATKVFGCVLDVLNYFSGGANTENIDVLVTGSLHLVGATLSAINNNK